MRFSHILKMEKRGFASFTYYELLHVSLEVHVGQVWHHVGHDLEACILGLLEALAHGTDGVAPENN